MRKLYRYHGSVGVMSAVGQTAQEITLYDSSDDSITGEMYHPDSVVSFFGDVRVSSLRIR